jgi:hypothetical protein
MSSRSPQREQLRQLVARLGLQRETLKLIAEATLPNLASEETLDDERLQSVNDAIETLILSGLCDDAAIAAEIGRYRQHHGEGWRDQLWSDRLTLACTRWLALGSPPGLPSDTTPLPAPATIGPIPPQPPGEIRSYPTPDTLAA